MAEDTDQAKIKMVLLQLTLIKGTVLWSGGRTYKVKSNLGSIIIIVTLYLEVFTSAPLLHKVDYISGNHSTELKNKTK